jgi:hypothetical protein
MDSGGHLALLLDSSSGARDQVVRFLKKHNG